MIVRTAVLSDDERSRAGIGTGLLRLSVGIEHVDDLLPDIQAGLARVARCSPREASAELLASQG